MTIVVTLSPEIEALLQARANRQGQDINRVASELLASTLVWDAQDTEEAIQGIQKGLDDFQSGKFRPFHEFVDEQCHKYNLPTNS